MLLTVHCLASAAFVLISLVEMEINQTFFILFFLPLHQLPYPTLDRREYEIGAIMKSLGQ